MLLRPLKLNKLRYQKLGKNYFWLKIIFAVSRLDLNLLFKQLVKIERPAYPFDFLLDAVFVNKNTNSEKKFGQKS